MAVALVIAVAVVASGALIVRPAPLSKWVGADDAEPGRNPSASPAPPPVLTHVPDTVPMPTAAGLHAEIDALVTEAGLGERFHVSVRDVLTGDKLYGRGAETPTVPASTTKLVTAAAVLAATGPGHRIPTRVVAGASPGEVVIIGGGDPTLAAGAKGAYPGAARMDQLAAQVRKALGDVSVTKVTVDVSLFEGATYGPGWDNDVPDYCSAAITALMVDGGMTDPRGNLGCSKRHSKPELVAGEAFARALKVPADVVADVSTGAAPASSTPAASSTPEQQTPTPGTELGQVESPPMIRLVEVMLAASDNTLAEALARQVALARGQPASFAGAAAAMEDVFKELGLDITQARLADGSGLSRQNRISPAFLTDLLVLAADGSRPELAALFSGLPVAGWSGTLARRYTSPAPDENASGLGVVRAKTGTLTKVYSLSGVVMTAEGRLLAFALMVDESPAGSWTAEPVLDRVAVRLASCGCR